MQRVSYVNMRFISLKHICPAAMLTQCSTTAVYYCKGGNNA